MPDHDIPDSSATETLLEFPCAFPIKAMGLANQDIQALILDILNRHQAEFAAEQVRQRASSSGKYLSVTVVVQATSKDQLDAIYRDLTAHPAIVYAL